MQLQIKASDCALAEPASDEAEGQSRPFPAAPLSLRLHDRMEPLAACWHAMEAQNNLSLHQCYDWCAAWVKTHACNLLIVEGVRDGRTQFILPLEIVRRGPVRVASLLATAFSNINTGLYAPEFLVAEGGTELRSALQQVRGEFARSFDLLLLEKIPLDWRGETSPFSSLPSVLNQNAAFQLELLEDFEETLAQLNAKRRRKKLRTSERRLAMIGGYEHVVARTDEEALALLDVFFRQKAARFKAMGLPDVFHSEEARNFFRQLALTRAQDDNYPLQLQAIRLSGENAGHIAAVTGLSRKGDHVICQFGSIDESIAADASPGEFLFHLAIQKASEDGARLFDFGIGDQPYKRSWCRIETPQHDLLWPVTVAGRAAAAAHRAKTTAKRFIKRNPRAYSLLQRFRKTEAGGGDET